MDSDLAKQVADLKAEITARQEAARAKKQVAFHGEGTTEAEKRAYRTWWINEERPAIKKLKVDYDRLRIEKAKAEHHDTDILTFMHDASVFKWKEALVQSVMDQEERKHNEAALIKCRRAIRRLRNQALLRQAMIHHAHLVHDGKLPDESIEEFTKHESHVDSLKAQLKALKSKHKKYMREYMENQAQSD